MSTTVSVHRRPSKGHDTIRCTRPPVATFAVPIVRITKPQKIAWCMTAARTSRNIRTCSSTCRTTASTRRGISRSG